MTAPHDVVRLTYRLETPGEIERLAAKIASDQSTGTFVALPGETPELKARVAARVVAIRPLPPADAPAFGTPDGRRRRPAPTTAPTSTSTSPSTPSGPTSPP